MIRNVVIKIQDLFLDSIHMSFCATGLRHYIDLITYVDYDHAVSCIMQNYSDYVEFIELL